MTLRTRFAWPLAALSCAFVTTGCEQRRRTRADLAAIASLARSSPLPPGSPARTAPVSSGSRESDAGGDRPLDCENEHWPEPWQPRQLTSKPRQAVTCTKAGCVSIEPVFERGDGCVARAELGKCRRATLVPRVVSGDPARDRKIQALLDAETVEFRAPDECWLTFLDYAVHQDDDGILDVSFRASGCGAYPDTQTSHLTILLASGERLRAASAFSRSKMPELLAAMKRRVLSAWRAAKKEHAEVFVQREEPVYGAEHLENFIVHGEGVTFFFDFGLPHAIQVATPLSEFPFTKAEIRRFIDPKGPLGFLRD